MHIKLKADLQSTIQQWMDEHSEDIDFPHHTVMGEETVVLMTTAAECVFNAVVEVQEYALREGFFEDV